MVILGPVPGTGPVKARLWIVPSVIPTWAGVLTSPPIGPVPRRSPNPSAKTWISPSATLKGSARQIFVVIIRFEAAVTTGTAITFLREQGRLDSHVGRLN